MFEEFLILQTRGSLVRVDMILRPCISFAIVLYHCSAPASASFLLGSDAARKAGSAASATRGSTSARNTVELCYWMRVTFQIERLNKPLNRTTPMNKSTGHPESGHEALDVKAKKNKSEAEASLMRD